MINASLLQEEQLATQRRNGQAGSSSSQPPPPGRGLHHAPRTEQLFTAADKEVMDLVERGEEQLLREAASKAYKLKQHYNNRGRIELGMTELSHLHAQLNSMTTQCTLIVGFALAGLGADTLAEIGNDQSEFCLYKAGLTRWLATMYIVISTLCIFFSMTVIACAQTIACESNVRMFDYAETHHVVLMTNILMHGDRRHFDAAAPAAPHPHPRGTAAPLSGPTKVRRRIVISHLFNLALFCFFLAAIMTIWLFLGTKNWIEIHPGAVNTTLVREPGADPSTVWNPFIIRTDAGRYYVQCEDPYDQEMGVKYERYGLYVASAGTAVFVVSFFVFVATRYYVESMYAPQQLRMLGDEAGPGADDEMGTRPVTHSGRSAA